MIKILNIIFIASFLLIVSFPTWVMLFDAKVNSSEFENRNLAQFPDLKNSNPNLLPEALQHFYDDHLGFRKFMIINQNVLESTYLHSPRLGNLMYGKNGFYFFNLIDPKLPNQNYKTIFFTPAELTKIKDELEKENEWFKAKSIPYFIVVVPDKEAIYPEYYPYPDNILTNFKLDQLEDYLKNNSTVRLIDLRESLIKDKSEKILLYFKRDTHWNQYGAFFAYQEIMRQLSKINSNIYIPKLPDFDVNTAQTNEVITGDLTRIAMLSQEPNQLQIRFIPNNNFPSKKKKLKKVFIYGDSFSKRIVAEEIMGLVPFLSFSFEQVFDRSYITDLERNQKWVTPLDYAEIEEEKPDLVIRETVQRNLRVFLGPEYTTF